MSIRVRSRALRSVLFLLASAHAFAACTVQPVFLPYHYRVGADAAHCEYNDIQSAINAVGECRTVIDITREHTYTNQHLSIDNKASVTLQGWGDGVTCADIPNTLSFPPYSPPTDIAPLVSLDGSGDGNGRVLTITGNSNVRVRNLTVLRGSASDAASGGGISFEGQGSLEITRSTISFNNAGYGGGINVDGSSGAATLTMDDNTLILSNTASTSGGGIRLEGNASLVAVRPQTLIAFNQAQGDYGGGVEVVGPATAHIGSPGYGGLGVIYDNSAPYGGGIAIISTSGEFGLGYIFSTDENHPTAIQNNSASHTGGGIYLKPDASLGLEYWAMVDLWDSHISDNTAPEGAAIYADVNSDLAQHCVESHIRINVDNPPAGSVRCLPSADCNAIDGNVNEDTGGNATDGSTILVQGDSTPILSCPGELTAQRLIMRNNHGAHAIRGLGAYLDLANCLIADNTYTGEIVRLDDDADGGHTSIDHCTISNNSITNGYVLYSAAGPVNVFNSIIDQPGHETADPAITDPAAVAHVLTNDRSTLPDTAYVQQGAPTFVNAANGDYHLVPASLGVDSAPAGDGTDLERKPRTVDLPDVANSFGPMDLGAYEIQLPCSHADTIFCYGFDNQ